MVLYALQQINIRGCQISSSSSSMAAPPSPAQGADALLARLGKLVESGLQYRKIVTQLRDELSTGGEQQVRVDAARSALRLHGAGAADTLRNDRSQTVPPA